MTKHTPHQVLAECQLARLHDETIRRTIQLRRLDLVPDDRLTAAGVPSLRSLEAERRRRERPRQVAAS